jgi:glyoxylase-like metal-dependent hydrolase (beta-lactamase superfamily II)
LPGGSTEQLLDSLRNKILPLGDDVVVYSGHGPETTIGRERLTNPFLTGRYFKEGVVGHPSSGKENGLTTNSSLGLLPLGGLVEALVLEFLPLVAGLALEVAGERLKGDVVIGAEGAPEDEAGVELPRLRVNLVGQFRFLFRHCSPPLAFPDYGIFVNDSVAERSRQ